VTIIPGVAPADMPAALFVAREVDAAITWEPFASQAEAQFRGTRVLFDGAAEWRKGHPGAPLYPVNVVIARQELIDGRPRELRRFLAGYEETLAFMNGQPAEANEVIAAELKLAPAVVAAARRRIDYGSRVDVQAALQTLGWSRQLGYVKEIPPEAALFDLAPLAAVVASRGGR
jgi:NitT/TauT family transport system substrate-binding protein